MSTKYLAHITTKENCEKIISDSHFNISVHSRKANQWLGDGIYFWDANDDNALKLGYRMVKNKTGNKSEPIQKISFLVNVDDEKHVNLEFDEWNKKFKEFLENSNQEGKKLLEMLNLLKINDYVSPKYLNKIGFAFGNSVNLFIKTLLDNNIEIDMISHYFYHKRRKGMLFSREELCYRQFCIKNPVLVNSIDVKRWLVDDMKG